MENTKQQLLQWVDELITAIEQGGLNSEKDKQIHRSLNELREKIEKSDDDRNDNDHIDWQMWIPLIGKFLLEGVMIAEHILKK